MVFSTIVLSIIVIILAVIAVLVYYPIKEQSENIKHGWVFLNTTQTSVIPLDSAIFNTIITPLNASKQMPCVGEIYGLFTPSTTDKIHIISFNTTSTTLLFSNSSLKYNFPYLYSNMTNCLLTLEEYIQ